MTDTLSQLAYLHSKPTAKAKLKAIPEHFIVKENLGFDFSGDGEHLMVKIRKVGENTSFVANELAKYCGVKSKDIGWAGLKDRHAVTEQWLSVHLPKADVSDFSEFEQAHPSIKVIEVARHNKKLRPGDLVGNEFAVTLSEVTDISDVEKRAAIVAEYGVPNYFGSQRFGRDGNNIEEARRWGRDNVRTRNQNKRSLYLSAARSYLFNAMVSARIERDLFSSVIVGDIVVHDGSHVQVDDKNIDILQAAINKGESELTAALAGDNALPTQGEALYLEQKIVDSEPDLMALIRGNRMRHDRRELLLKPKDFAFQVEEGNITLTFSLSSGSFATSIVRELVEEIPVERVFNEG